ncbi:hypothetical protein ACLOJK_014792 [Asimina triloba]
MQRIRSGSPIIIRAFGDGVFLIKPSAASMKNHIQKPKPILGRFFRPSMAALQLQSRCRNGWPIHISADQRWATQSEGQPTHITVHRLSAAKSNPEKSGQ